MAKFTTLVFRSDTEESIATVRDMVHLDICRAWSTDDEILRLELIEQAIDINDISQAKKYIRAGDVAALKDDLAT